MANKKTPSRKTTGRKAPPSGRRTAVSAVAVAKNLSVQAPDVLPLTIVGVGASAGGLEAFSQLLQALPKNPDMAFVLIQHLAPQHESALPNLLAGKTEMPVLQISDAQTLAANHVYVIPPNAYVSVSDGKLFLKPRSDDRADRAPFMPIDYFFRSLAEYAHSLAIGIVLSGTASDGAAGLREIKASGGITLAQDPNSARYDGMPRAAISTGSVDLVLTPEGIGAELARLNSHPYLAPGTSLAEMEEAAPADQHLYRIFSLLLKETGVDFTQYKQPTIKRRLQRRMALHRLQKIDQYLQFLEDEPSEILNLYQDILIQVTRFFRETPSFEALSEKVYPKLMQNQTGEAPIRAWVPGCSTGEEVYSLAISLVEYRDKIGSTQPIQIFGTDISEVAIERARGGVYPENISADVSPERLRLFFSKVDAHYRIKKTIRDMCVFARQDLSRDPPFSKLDLILCRNVLIYLGQSLQRRVLRVFHYALKPEGFLMLAGTETIGPNVELFSSVDKKHQIYRKKDALPAADVRFGPVATPGFPAGFQARRQTGELQTRVNLQHEANRILLGRYAPPAVVIDENWQILEFKGQTGPFLEPAPGDASLNLLKMAREGMMHDVRNAVHEARKRGTAVRREGVRVKSNGGWRTLTLEALPVGGGEKSSRPTHIMVVFDAVKARPARRDRAAKKNGRDHPRATEVTARLEQELAANRDYLQSIIQDLEAANEELQSANEEILSSNEELQSTNEELDTAKEELQSTNEELNTVNEELHGRNEELTRLNSDLFNLLANVQIPIVMVSSDMRIRRFTPMAERILNLIPTDLGRPVGHIKPNIRCPDLEQLIVEAMDSVTTVQQEVQDYQGAWFSLRVRPYKNIDDKIDGAVLTLIDIGQAKSYEKERRDASDYGESFILTVHEPVLVVDAELRVRCSNAAFSKSFGLSLEIAGTLIHELGPGWASPELRSRLEGLLASGQPIEGLELEELSRTCEKKIIMNARRIAGEQDGKLALLAMQCA
jgi:two-component system CheB/CheR fusion protein